jgi:hypothetical protein
MDGHTGERVVHSYDVATRRIPCGAVQARSTKHASAVTCVTCRELLRPASRAAALAGGAASDASGR